MVKHSSDSPDPLGQITPSAEKHNRVKRNTDSGQMLLVRGEKVTQHFSLFQGWSYFQQALLCSLWVFLEAAYCWNLLISSSKNTLFPYNLKEWGLGNANLALFCFWNWKELWWYSNCMCLQKKTGRAITAKDGHIKAPRPMKEETGFPEHRMAHWENWDDKLKINHNEFFKMSSNFTSPIGKTPIRGLWKTSVFTRRDFHTSNLSRIENHCNKVSLMHATITVTERLFAAVWHCTYDISNYPFASALLLQNSKRILS